MAANGISTLPLKYNRQVQKLALAGADRDARNQVEPGRYSDITADITQLPTTYNPADNNDPVDTNPNTGGLLPGRPWA